MEPLIILVVLVVLGTPIGVVIALVRQSNLSRRIENLEADLRATKEELRSARENISEQPSVILSPSRLATLLQREQPAVAEPPPNPVKPKSIRDESLPLEEPQSPASPALTAGPPPIPIPIPVSPPLPVPALPAEPEPARVIDWEKFLGVKLFSWVGGLALFLGVAFFVKYSFERNLIPPEMRVALGFLVGLGLVVGGAIMRKKEYP